MRQLRIYDAPSVIPYKVVSYFQDHRRVKQRIRPMLGFKRFNYAVVTISAIELAEKIKKGQFKTGKLVGAEASCQNYGTQHSLPDVYREQGYGAAAEDLVSDSSLHERRQVKGTSDACDPQSANPVGGEGRSGRAASIHSHDLRHRRVVHNRQLSLRCSGRAICNRTIYNVFFRTRPK